MRKIVRPLTIGAAKLLTDPREPRNVSPIRAFCLDIGRRWSFLSATQISKKARLNTYSPIR
jgi:hypothetical protein